MTEKNAQKSHDVNLSTPVKIDGKDVTDIDLRKPQTGELRGLKMTDVLQMDTDAMIKLLPRITQPALTSAQVASLDPADFIALCGKAVLFFREEVGASGAGSEYLKLPDDVEDAMADIASVFHWQPDAMDGMSIEELARWREKARERFEAQNNTGHPPLNRR